MGRWNPLKCAGTALPVPLLLAAKLIALALLLTGHVKLLPDPFWLRVALVVSALALLFNRWPRASCLALGGTLLFAAAPSKANYGNDKTFCGLMLVMVGALGVPAGFWVRRLWPYAIWVSLLVHAALLEFTGTAFTMFFYAMQAAVLVFVVWPKELVVIYDGDCGICNRIRGWLERVDFDRQFTWQPLQSDAGGRWGIAREALEERLHLVADGRVSTGFRACKLIVLYNPAFLLLVAAAIAAPPNDWAWYRRAVVALLLAFFFPVFNPIGEWAYGWVARNRRRFSSGSACAVEPGASGPG